MNPKDKARLLAVLEPMHERMAGQEDKIEGLKLELATVLARIEGKLDDAIKVAIDNRTELDTLRGRVLEEASRTGEQVRRHEGKLIELDAWRRQHELDHAKDAEGNGAAE